MYTNARNTGNKQEELEILVQLWNYYAFGIPETWWDSSYKRDTIVDGYKLFRKGKIGGSVVSSALATYILWAVAKATVCGAF